jgi:hypothetical protein
MHESCPVSGRLFAVGAGRVGEIFIGVTRGYVAGGELDPDAVLAHLDDICDLADYYVPVDMGDYAKWMRSIIPGRS